MDKNIKSGYKTGLKRLRDPFSDKYHHFGHYRPNYGKSNFSKNCDFGDFHEILNFQDMADLLAECVPKCDLRIAIASTESQDTLKYLG